QLAGVCDSRDPAHEVLQTVIDDGSALRAFRRFVEQQGGDPRVVDDPSLLPRAPHETEIAAPVAGHVAGFDCAAVGRACGMLGGGRAKAEDAIDHGVGIEVLVSVGDAVDAGAPLFKVTYRDEDSLAAATETLVAAVCIGDAPTVAPLVYEVMV